MTEEFFTLRELVRIMEETPGADYSNWGISVMPEEEEEIFIGPEQEDMELAVPLMDILDAAASSYPGHGLEEVILLYGVDEDGKFEWGLGVARE